MNLYEQSCVSKVFLAAMGVIDRRTVTNIELETTFKALEIFADNNSNWNESQKEFYKFLVNFVKELMKGNTNG